VYDDDDLVGSPGWQHGLHGVFNVSDFGNEWDRMLSHRRLSAK